MKKKKFTKLALVLSVVLLIAWGILGTGATLAWFTDTTPVDRNSFVVGMMDLKVSYRNDLLTDYTEMTTQSALFNDQALYEPNYTQVVYLMIENKGDIDFRYKLSVDLAGYSDSTNVYGGNLHLPEYLRYGVVFGATEADLDRQLAQIYADRDMMELHALNQYSEVDEIAVAVGETRYAALVVYMPWQVGNEANYLTGKKPPTVQLGVTVFAQQADAPLE